MITAHPIPCAVHRTAATAATNARTYATRRPIKPPQKIRDPLTTSKRASITQIKNVNNTNNPPLTFIHRPPPSTESPLSFTSAPSSPLLRPPTPLPSNITHQILPPLLHPQKSPLKTLSEQEIDDIRTLRNQDPTTNTAGKLAKQFGCSSKFVGLVAPLTKPVKENQLLQTERAHAAMRERWGERKWLVKSIREKRRTFW